MRSGNCRDLTPAKIAGSEDEYPGAACAQRSNLQRTVSQPLILGQHHPATFSDRLEPDAVFRVTSEMIIVNLDHETGLDEFRSSGSMPSDRSIKKTVSSGGFTADGFFDLTDLQMEVLREVRNGIARLVPLVDG